MMTSTTKLIPLQTTLSLHQEDDITLVEKATFNVHPSTTQALSLCTAGPKDIPLENQQTPRNTKNEEDSTDANESAIYDDDDSMWEDYEDSGESCNTTFSSVQSPTSVVSSNFCKKATFQRINPKDRLISRSSLITLGLKNGSSLATMPDEFSSHTPLPSRRDRYAFNACTSSDSNEKDEVNQVEATTQRAFSPRTTRRNMLSTELPPSLRQHLLHERQQKSQTANAVLKRKDTVHDVANLKQYPEKVHLDKSKLEKDISNAILNQYFSPGLGEYHSKGW